MLKFSSLEISFFLSCLFYLATATNVCPGDELSFTCETNTSSFTWTVTPDGGTATTCVAVRSPMPSVTDRTCGPNDEFSVNISEDNSTSTLSTQSVDESLNETSVVCHDGNVNQSICIINTLQSPKLMPATVSGFSEEENMCQLSLEWSETIVSCDGNVSYTVTVTPCMSRIEDCNIINGSPMSTFLTPETQQNLTVNGSIGLEYRYTLTSKTCDGGANTSPANSVNLRAQSNGSEPFYNYVYNSMNIREAINVTWSRYQILNKEAAYRVVINGEIFDIMTAQNCSGGVCNYVYYSDSLTTSSAVAVDIVGCVTERISVKASPGPPPGSTSDTGGLSGGAIAGIVIVIIAAAITLTTHIISSAVVWFKKIKKGHLKYMEHIDPENKN